MDMISTANIPDIKSAEFIDWLVKHPMIKIQQDEIPCEEILHQMVFDECNLGFPLEWQTTLSPSAPVDISRYTILSNKRICQFLDKLKEIGFDDVVKHFLANYRIRLDGSWKTKFRKYTKALPSTLTVKDCGELNEIFAELVAKYALESLEIFRGEVLKYRHYVTNEDVMKHVEVINNLLCKIEKTNLSSVLNLVETV